jgi:DMSO/TMAO reductase YedYZ molybdopterin-dependent catalytic subunit
LTAIFGLVLLGGISILFVTGLLSYAAYNPALPGNDFTPGKGILGFYLFPWPTRPAWLYRLTQGVHVILGLVLIPVLLGKLWSVIPKLFEWPAARSASHLLERVSLLVLVGGVVFEFVTGVLDIQYWYTFPGSFYRLHLYGAWVFIAAFIVHVGLKFPRMRRGLRSRRLRTELATDTAHTEPEPAEASELVPTAPATATMSRRGVLGLVGAGSLVILGATVGQSIGGPARRTALLAPRGHDLGTGPNGFPVNKTAATLGVTDAAGDPGWRLELRGGPTTLTLSRQELLAMPQHTASLPIACVEGWSTANQAWRGVRLADLAARAGVPTPASARVNSLQKGGPFGHATLRGNQVHDPESLLALRVNDADLSLDHGYPARVIVPGNPGVHNTKWVARITFEA